MLKCTITIAIVLTINSLVSSANDDILINIGEADGLSQRWIRSIYQDTYGFMWFATKDGVNRYDGYEFRHYLSLANENNLASSTINDITADTYGNVWACTNLGASYYDRERDIFKNFPYIQNTLVETMLQYDSNTYWFATVNGLYKFSTTDSSINLFQHNANEVLSLCNNSLTSLLIDKQKNIWIGSLHGLSIYNPMKGEFILLNSEIFPNSYIFDMAMDSTGRIWISDYNNGVYVYIPNNELYSPASFKLIIPGLGRTLRIYDKNQLWVSWGQKQGVTSYNIDLFNNNNLSFAPSGIGKRLLKNYSIEGICMDKWQNMWFGTYDIGIFYQSKYAKNFKVVNDVHKKEMELCSYLVNTFLKDGNYFWIGTEVGLNRHNISTGETKYYTYNPNNPRTIGSNSIFDLTKDSQGNLWIGTWDGGLNLYNPVTDDFTRFNFNPNDSTGIISNHVFAITEVNPGELWIGTIQGGGLMKYNIRNKKFTNLSASLKIKGVPDYNSVNCILKAHDGQIWISSFIALHVYNPSTGQFRWYAYNKNNNKSLTLGDIEVIFEDSKKNIWLGTEGGLNVYIPATDNFRHFTIKEGLPSNFISGVNEDNKGNIWVSTNKGISKIVNGAALSSNPKILNYTTEDGLSCREFIKRSTYRDQQNRLYFGGVNGYTYFNPDSIFSNPIVPSVLLTDLSIRNEKVLPGSKGSVLTKSLYLLNEIDLKYSDNMISVQYASLNFLNPGKNKYSYMLEGYDEKWISGKKDNIAIYTNLDPGKYILHVKASNNDGVWNETGTSIIINIHPPWWRTIIAQTMLYLLVIGGLFYIYNYRMGSIKRQKKLLENLVNQRTTELTEVNTMLEESKEEVTMQNEELLHHRTRLEELVEERTIELRLALKKSEEADKLKSSFLANMSHEIRTPMNAIVGFANLLDADDLDSESKQMYIKIINNNTETLLVLINDILEISIIEADQVNIQYQLFDIDDEFKLLEETHRLKNSKEVSVEFINKKNKHKTMVYSDPIRLSQCMSNLINNALKFTDKGSVKFGYTIKENVIEFYVVDTGIGIDPGETENIFNYFYKIEKSTDRLYRGTGLGLAITSKLVNLMGGNILVKSELNIGSTFYIRLPYFENEKVTKNLPEVKLKLQRDFKDLVILIAEDEPANFLLLQETLKKTGAKVVVVLNGEDAVKFVKENAKQENLLVLMDIKMPKMDGIIALEEILKTGIKIPVVAITAYARQQDKHVLLKAGFTDYLSKPIHPAELIALIRKIMLD